MKILSIESLRELDLSENMIGSNPSRGEESCFTGFEGTRITTLNVSLCGLSQVDLECIVSSRTLEYLAMGHNGFVDPAVLSCMAGHPTLKEIRTSKAVHIMQATPPLTKKPELIGKPGIPKDTAVADSKRRKEPSTSATSASSNTSAASTESAKHVASASSETSAAFAPPESAEGESLPKRSRPGA